MRHDRHGTRGGRDRLPDHDERLAAGEGGPSPVVPHGMNPCRPSATSHSTWARSGRTATLPSFSNGVVSATIPPPSIRRTYRPERAIVSRMKRYVFLAGIYIGLVILANWLASRYVVSVGFGKLAPAGVFCIGGVLVLRDWLQQLRGLLWTMPLVYSAGLASWAIGDAAGWTSLEKIAVASVVAFTISETVEAVVFTPFGKGGSRSASA